MDSVADLDVLVSDWTLLEPERVLVEDKFGTGRLGFALSLKGFIARGRFSASVEDFSSEVVAFVAAQLGVDPADAGGYDWAGRTGRRHREEIRAFLGFRECSVADADRLRSWLEREVCEAERDPARVRVELAAEFVAQRIEPPSDGRIDRLVSSALFQAEVGLTERVVARLGASAAAALEGLLAGAGEEEATGSLTHIRTAPGNVSLATMLAEIAKLRAVRAVDLPPDLFFDVAPAVLAGWRARAAVESPSHLRRHQAAMRLTLLAALVHEREREITDTLVDLLISTVHRIGARADRKVTQELVNAFKRVSGKENILFAIAEASLQTPDEPVRSVVFPAVAGGEQTLRELVHEFKTKGPVYRHTVQTTLEGSYTGHYRRGLIELLDVLEFRSNNERHRPVLDALELVAEHAGARGKYYPADLHVPQHRWMLGNWEPLVFKALS